MTFRSTPSGASAWQHTTTWADATPRAGAPTRRQARKATAASETRRLLRRVHPAAVAGVTIHSPEDTGSRSARSTQARSKRAFGDRTGATRGPSLRRDRQFAHADGERGHVCSGLLGREGNCSPRAICCPGRDTGASARIGATSLEQFAHALRIGARGAPSFGRDAGVCPCQRLARHPLGPKLGWACAGPSCAFVRAFSTRLHDRFQSSTGSDSSG